MTYVTSWERIAEKRGRLEGIIEGKKEEKTGNSERINKKWGFY